MRRGERGRGRMGEEQKREEEGTNTTLMDTSEAVERKGKEE